MYVSAMKRSDIFLKIHDFKGWVLVTLGSVFFLYIKKKPLGKWMVLRAQEEFAQTFWCSDELTIWSFRIIYGFIDFFCIWLVYQRHFEASQARIGSKTVKKCSDTFSECQEGPKQLLYITWSHLSNFWTISHIGSGGSARWQTFVTRFVTPDKN